MSPNTIDTQIHHLNWDQGQGPDRLSLDRIDIQDANRPKIGKSAAKTVTPGNRGSSAIDPVET
ncbi:hypothetical protein [Mesobacterium pallidum]|uniref:hypothetical protein n=1 Tax=Mesobacterium pallidum TaxID=2872037 RepID=UPI001EE2A422|nr:hypothetical protein [Mesobacterium pallidum]